MRDMDSASWSVYPRSTSWSRISTYCKPPSMAPATAPPVAAARNMAALPLIPSLVAALAAPRPGTMAGISVPIASEPRPAHQRQSSGAHTPSSFSASDSLSRSVSRILWNGSVSDGISNILSMPMASPTPAKPSPAIVKPRRRPDPTSPPADRWNGWSAISGIVGAD